MWDLKSGGRHSVASLFFQGFYILEQGQENEAANQDIYSLPLPIFNYMKYAIFVINLACAK